MRRQVPIKKAVYRRFGSIDVVLLDTRRAPLRQWVRYLSAADRREWRAIRARKSAKLFLASRAMALPMARHLDRHKQHLTRLPTGQPVLRKGFISISRCYPFVAFALARKPVGIDLELIRRDDDLIDAVAPSFSAEEQTEIRKSAFRASCFCRIWSRKEALAKLAGTGISTDLAALDTLHPEACLRSLQLRGRYWLSLAG